MALTILQSLQSINAYPILVSAIESIIEARCLVGGDSPDYASQEYQLAKADVLMWLSQAPDITQAGISYRFSDKDRLSFRNQALTIYNGWGVDVSSSFTYGDKGELF